MIFKADFTDIMKAVDNAVEAAIPAGKYGLYETARITADAIRSEAGTLPYKGSTVSQIQNAVGIAKMDSTVDTVTTAVSFDGYFEESHFPIIFFVREICQGTSRIPQNDFMRRAAARVKAQAEQTGQKAAEDFVNRILKGAD